MLNSPTLSIFQHFHAIPLRSPLISLRSKWRLTGFSRRFTPKNPVRLHKPFGQLPRWGAKNILPLNLIAFPARKADDTRIPSSNMRRNRQESLEPQLPVNTLLFSPSFLWKEVPRSGGGWLSIRDEVVKSTVFPVIPLLTSFLDRKRKRFLAFARNDDAGRLHTPSFLWKEVP